MHIHRQINLNNLACSILGKRDSIEFIRIFATGGYGLDNLKLLKEKYHLIYDSYYK